MLKFYRMVDIARIAVVLSCLYRIIWFCFFPTYEVSRGYAILIQLGGFALPIGVLYLLQLILQFYIQRKGSIPEKLPRHRRLLYSLMASAVVSILCVRPIFWLSIHFFSMFTNS